MRVPLAWRNLASNRQRLVVSVVGIASAVVLMFMEVGFFNAMLDSQVALIHILDGSLVLVNRTKSTLSTNMPFPRRRLYQALAVDGVVSAYPVFIEMEASVWRNPQERTRRPLRVIAFDPDHPLFRPPDIERMRRALREADTALFDVKSRPEYGVVRPGLTTELAGRRIHVVGIFTLGRDFTNEGNAIVSATNFARLFPHRAAPGGDLESVELGVVQTAPGADALAIRRVLRDALPDDVAIFTRDELVRKEMSYWQTSVPIGYVFGLGAVMGFVIGSIICYQILFNDVSDHLPQFATLKAIGYPNRYLVGVVVRQGLLLSILGFVPGSVVAHVLYRQLDAAAGLPMQLTVPRLALVQALTMVMTVLSGLLAVRRAVAADPAEVFG